MVGEGALRWRVEVSKVALPVSDSSMRRFFARVLTTNYVCLRG